jgi:hypothetical protein
MKNLTLDNLEDLPHGSGIDCDWQIDNMGKYFKCINSYHCMNENGMYDGYADFTLIIFKKPYDFHKRFNPTRTELFNQVFDYDFNLHFNGSFSQWKNRQHMLREYLEDTFSYFLDKIA